MRIKLVRNGSLRHITAGLSPGSSVVCSGGRSASGCARWSGEDCSCKSTRSGLRSPQNTQPSTGHRVADQAAARDPYSDFDARLPDFKSDRLPVPQRKSMQEWHPKVGKLLCRNFGLRYLRAYTGRLLTVFEAEEHKSADESHPPLAQSLAEPLSKRELDVLQLIAQGLSNREISARLFVALDTVKGHNRRIFGKLLVQRRTDAVVKARSLGILHPR